MPPPLDILFEDNHVIAVAKPAPLLTQGVPPGIPTLESLVKDYLRTKYHKAGNVYLGIPHRLDRPVSGVVVFARNSKAARRLAEQFQGREVAKLYWAAVEGQVAPDQGIWEDWLLKVADEARSVRVERGTPGARRAVLHYRCLQHTAAATLLELHPETGRMHQIRIQTSVRGWPVCGDVQYGATAPFGPAAAVPRDRIIALHARSLTFLHPLSYQPMTLTAPLPSVWTDRGFVV